MRCRVSSPHPSGSNSDFERSGMRARQSRSRSVRAESRSRQCRWRSTRRRPPTAGTRVTPHLLKAVDDGGGWKPVAPPAPQSKAEFDPRKLQAIRDGLWVVVNAPGTGRKASIKDHDVAGKTGTAQVISNEGRAAARTTKDLRDNGWFVFFAPRDNPQIAGVVFLEHGMHGPNAAAVTHHILETFFAT